MVQYLLFIDDDDDDDDDVFLLSILNLDFIFMLLKWIINRERTMNSGRDALEISESAVPLVVNDKVIWFILARNQKMQMYSHKI